MFCSHCGKEIDDLTERCPYCFNNVAPNTQTESNKSWTITFLLCLFGGVLGLHRFYTKDIKIGVTQVLLLLGSSFWLHSLVKLSLGAPVDVPVFKFWLGFVIIFAIPVFDLITLVINKYLSSENLEEYNKKLIIAGIIVPFIFFSIISSKVQKMEENNNFEYNNTMLALGLNKYKKLKLKPETISYLQSGHLVKSYTKTNKKIVLYISKESCPVRKQINDLFEKYATHNYYKYYYNFEKLNYDDMLNIAFFADNKTHKLFVSFVKQCGDFCIINPKTQESIPFNAYTWLTRPKMVYNALVNIKDW